MAMRARAFDIVMQSQIEYILLNAMKRFALFPGPKCFELIESIHLHLIAIRIIVTFRERPHFNIDCVMRACGVCVFATNDD